MSSGSSYAIAVLVIFGPTFLPAAEPNETPKPLNVIARQRADEDRILAALEKRIAFDAKEMPLADVIARVAKETGVDIRLDRESFTEKDTSPNSPISFVMVDVSARTVMKHLLKYFELEWVVRDGLLWITSYDEANSPDFLTIRVHDISDLIGQNAQAADCKPLVPILEQTVGQHSWQTNGRPGGAAVVAHGGRAALVVSQQFSVHEEIESVLAELRKAKKLPPITEFAAKPDRAANADPAEPPVTAEQKRLLAALERPISVQFRDTPFADCLWFFRNALQERILVERDVALTQAERRVSLELKNVPVREALDRFVKFLVMEKEGKIGWELGERAVCIGQINSEFLTHTKYYSLAGWIDEGEPERVYKQAENFLQMVYSSTLRDERGKSQASAPFVYGNKAVLIVRHTWSGHRQIAAIFAELRKCGLGPAPGAGESVQLGPARPVSLIEKRLAEKIAVDFDEASWNQAAEFLSQELKTPVVCGSSADREKCGARPVTFRSKSVPAASVLDQLAQLFHLDWTVDNDMIVFGSQGRSSTRVFDVRDLALRRDKAGKRVADFDSLMNAITAFIAPTTWDVAGGLPSIQPFKQGDGMALVVYHTREIHDEIDALLANLRHLIRPTPDDPPLKIEFTMPPHKDGESDKQEKI